MLIPVRISSRNTLSVIKYVDTGISAFPDKINYSEPSLTFFVNQVTP